MIRASGRSVALSVPPDGERAKRWAAYAIFFIVDTDAAELEQRARLVDHGELLPLISQTFPLADGRTAFETGTRVRPPGKTVVVVR